MCVYVRVYMYIYDDPFLALSFCHSQICAEITQSYCFTVRTLSTIIQPHSSVTANDILCLRMLNYILDNIFLYSFMYSIFFLHSCLSLYHSTKRLTFFSHMTLFRAK